MKKVFFGGSRQLGRLNKAVRERADNIISNGYLVLVGDADGADKAMQSYLAEKLYQHVQVFCTGGECRNNLGHWETIHVQADRRQRDFQYYILKDKKMSEEADYGFMLWDGKSKGTLNNIINLIEQKKSVLVYFSREKEFFTLKSDRDIMNLLALCDQMVVKKFEKALKLQKRIHSPQSHLNIV